MNRPKSSEKQTSAGCVILNAVTNSCFELQKLEDLCIHNKSMFVNNFFFLISLFALSVLYENTKFITPDLICLCLIVFKKIQIVYLLFVIE